MNGLKRRLEVLEASVPGDASERILWLTGPEGFPNSEMVYLIAARDEQERVRLTAQAEAMLEGWRDEQA